MGFNVFIFVSDSLSYVFDEECCTKKFHVFISMSCVLGKECCT
jgi:hypothetical protein